MQILFAAPFLLAARLTFTVLSLTPGARRWAIPIPSGIIATGPCVIAALLAVSISLQHVAPKVTWAGRVAYTGVGIALAIAVIGGVVIGGVARMAASLLPTLLLRTAVFVAAWCSYFVLVVGINFLSNLVWWHDRAGTAVLVAVLGLDVILSLIAAFFIAKRSEQFRPKRIHLPKGRTFHGRTPSGAEALTEK